VKRPADYKVVAAYTGMPVGTVRAKVARRQIPHYRLGPQTVRFCLDEIDSWLAERAVAVAPKLDIAPTRKAGGQ
jgi:excisionase family DNA binding protein